MVSLTTSIIFSKDETYGTSVNLCQSSSGNILTIFHHSQEAKIQPMVLKAWYVGLFSTSKTLSQASLLSPLPALLHPTTLPFAFHSLGHIYLCFRALVLAPLLVQNSFPHMAHIFPSFRSSQMSTYQKGLLWSLHIKKQLSLSCHSLTPKTALFFMLISIATY